MVATSWGKEREKEYGSDGEGFKVSFWGSENFLKSIAVISVKL